MDSPEVVRDILAPMSRRIVLDLSLFFFIGGVMNYTTSLMF